jgi:hypothetical protein
LPEKPVTVGDHWQHSEKLMAAMLGLEEVAKTTVKSTLKEVTPIVARFEFSGHVEGAIYGIATVIDVKGKYRFNLKTKRIDWLGMVIRENRPDCFIADGVDACSRLQMTMTPAKEPESLSEAALSKMNLKSTPDRLALQYESPDASWQCHCDRRWYVHHQRPKASEAVLRFLDRGMLVGQCNLSSLAAHEPGKSISLDEFQADVRRALGESFGEFVEAGQSANATNCRVYRVVVQGVYHTKLDKSESEIPMRWIYYLVTDAQGRQVAMTFAVEQSTLERFANADKLMIGSLQFAEKKKGNEETKPERTAKSGENRG